ncbi:3-ketodihydrosphingosine reductase-like protein tsc10 [Hyaloscypha sp. PMI_1271]|nr:3-ketodihydrosphingosine reductase-like protein tsc10 [Hyaloscypha sp. PMI_1271]
MADIINYWTIASIVAGLAVLLPFIMGFFSGNKFDVKGKTVLITGASEGMGKSVAKQLAQKGANIIIVSRNVGRLEEALAEVKASAADPSTQRFQYISADLSEPDGNARVIAEAIAWNKGQAPDVVWCIAGAAIPGLFIETSPEIMRRQMDVNFFSCNDMAHAILNEWLQPASIGKGSTRHLIFTSSVAGVYTIAGYTPYSPSKAAIKSLSDTLVQEMLLYGDDVKIHTVFPGSISSPGLERENKTKPEITLILEEADKNYTPDETAASAIAGLERGDYLVTVSFLGSLMRATSWGPSKKNNYLVDTAMTWLASIVNIFVGMDLDSKVKAYGKKHGHPSTYPKNAQT